MTFQDIFSSDFLNQLGGDLSGLQIGLSLLLSFAMGLFIFFVYKRTYQGVMYSKTFNISLIGLAMITSAVILAVTSNIILSLGMVGALSIVRFRTAIKDPIDVVYMFWAIAAGIISGAGLYLLALISCLVIGIVLFVFAKVNIRYEPYLLVINFNGNKTEKDINKILQDEIGAYRIKSKIKTPDNFELTVEIRTKTDKSAIVNTLGELGGIKSVAMVSYDGDYMA